MEVFVSVLFRFPIKKGVGALNGARISPFWKLNFSSGKKMSMKKTMIVMPTHSPQPAPISIENRGGSTVNSQNKKPKKTAQPSTPPNEGNVGAEGGGSPVALPRPSDGKSYICPEYYQHNKFTFCDFLTQMKNGKAIIPPVSGVKPVRPSDGKSYVVPEYYQHEKYSFAHYEIEMRNMRLPQPSSKRPLAAKK